MNKFNFEPQDLSMCTKYDGFIDRDGNYYIVKERINAMSRAGHNEWADQYMKNKRLRNFQISQTYSMILALSRLSSPTEILVHCYGYAYYSHDPIFYKPIILLPDSHIAGYKATSDQIDSLFDIMLFNNEDPYHKDILINSNIIVYNGLDEELGGKVRCKNYK